MMLEKWLKLSDRVRRMTRSELVDRCRQEAAKRSDAAFGRLVPDFSGNSRIVSTEKRGRFFFSPEQVDSILGLIKQRLPGRAEQIIAEADQILEHRVDLLGYRSLDTGHSREWGLDWHGDAVHRKHAPRHPAYRVRYLDFDSCGDSKITWELNRHQHLVTLAKACRLTGDLRYLDELLRQWRHWQAENPYPIGINWASSLEVAIRSLSWLWSYFLLQGSPHVYDFREEWLRGLALHGRHIARYLSTYFSPNTHLLGEGVGLFFLGVLCPELPAADRWKKLGWEIILRESERQVYSDGFYFEQSTYYHVYALDFLLHAVVLANLNQVEVPPSLEKMIEQMCSALCLLGRFGPPPCFGDDDGGRLFDGRRNQSEHLLDPLSTGAILFHRGDFKAVAGNLTEETLWLLGEEGAGEWERLERVHPASESAQLGAAGYYVLAADDSQAVADCGPMGAHSAGHGHADALSICLQSRGQPLLIDCGTFEYVGPGNDREAFRGTGMHNTVCVDDLSQARPAGAFSWEKLAKTRVECWIRGENFDLLTASHDGYCRLPQPVVHRRWVVSFRNGMYLVRDVLEGTGRHRIDIAWHLAPGLEPAGDGCFRTENCEAGIAFTSPFGSGWNQEVRQGQHSPAYGRKAPIKVLHFTNELFTPAEFTIVLKSTTQFGKAGEPFFRHVEEGVNGVSRYEYTEDGQLYSFIFNEDGRRFDCGAFSSDARFVCHRSGMKDGEEQLIMCRGSFVSADRGAELRSTRSIEWAELRIKDGNRVISSSDPSAAVNVDVAPLATVGIHDQV